MEQTVTLKNLVIFYSILRHLLLIFFEFASNDLRSKIHNVKFTSMMPFFNYTNSNSIENVFSSL